MALMSENLYVDAQQAADMLGVKAGTLYAYVSRKGLRSFAVEGSRKRLYWRADIQALLDEGPFEAADSVQALVRSTALTLLTKTGLYYRGKSATALAEIVSLEDVAILLWDAPGDIFDDVSIKLPDQTLLSAALGDIATIEKTEKALSLLPLLEHCNPRSADISPTGFARTSAGLLRWMAFAMSGSDVFQPDEPVHRVVARSALHDGRYDDLVRRTLVLAADHELDPTTFAVRAAANTGITPYGAVLVGLVTGRGQRVRHTRALTTYRFVRELLASADPSREVVRLVRAGEALPGFASAELHSAHDPRAMALIEAMRTQLADDGDFVRLNEAIATAAELRQVSPEFIIPVVFLAHKLGYADEPLSFLLPGRAVGWLAHAQEQYVSASFLRPRAAYTGILPERPDGPGE